MQAMGIDQLTSVPADLGIGRTRTERVAIRRLLWGGAVSLAIFVICAVIVIRQPAPQDQSQYLSQILNARVDPMVSPNATITMFEKKDEHVTVLWVNDLQWLPAEYAAK